jgi:predicted outer membrane repeat protein
MFNLDIAAINFIYNFCKNLGGVFNFGALEGAIMYLGIFAYGYFTVTNKKKVK